MGQTAYFQMRNVSFRECTLGAHLVGRLLFMVVYQGSLLNYPFRDHFVEINQGIGKDVPLPTYPYGKSIYKPYIVVIYGL